VFFDEDFDPLECEACSAADLAGMGGSYESCAYSVEIPCDTIAVECGEPTTAPFSPLPTESMMPTDCTMPAPPKVFDSMCVTTGGEVMETPIPMPENAIVVTTQNNGDNLGFTVSQEWVEEAGMAIRIDTVDCIVKGNMTLGSKDDFEGECLAGFTSVTLVVFFDSDFDPLECEACNADDLADMGGSYESWCAYSVEIPCDTIAVECGEGSTVPPTIVSPTKNPTVSPTTVSPTKNPTNFPTTISPTKNPTISPTTISPTKNPTVSPTTQEPSMPPTDRPTTSTPTISPSKKPVVAPTPEPTKPPIVTNGGSGDSGDIIEFPSVCKDDIKLLKTVGTITDVSVHETDAIRIISQDRSTVTVQLNQAWESPGDEEIPLDHIFYAFRPDNFNEKCYEETQVIENTVYGTITIQCAVTKPYALLEICIADDIKNEKLTWNENEENATVPKCCHPSFSPETPVICYSFEISCVTECDVEGEIARGRSLLRGSK